MNFRQKNKLNLDPRTKILLILLGNILIFSYGESLYLHIATTLAIVLTALLGKIKLAFKMATVYIVLYGLTFIISFAPKEISSIWGLMVLPIIMFMPLFAIAFMLFSTTTISEVITALQKMKCPSAIITPFIVMFRFFPTLKLELYAIRDAMKLKGIRKNPIKLLEYVYAPLLFNAIKIGEELNVSGVTRGLGLYKTSTQIATIRFGFLDFIVILMMIALILLRREVIVLW